MPAVAPYVQCVLTEVENITDKLELIRTYRTEGGTAEYIQPVARPSFLQLHLSKGEYLMSIQASDLPAIMSEFLVSCVEELLERPRSCA